MAGTAWVLFYDPCGCSIGRLTTEGPVYVSLPLPMAESTPETLAQTIADELKKLGYKGESLLMAIYSAAGLASSFLLEDPANARNRQALLYELESALPVAVEDLIVDFVLQGSEVFGIAYPLELLKPLVNALEARHVLVQSIIPKALLAMLSDRCEGRLRDLDVLVWQENECLEYVLFSREKPVAWRHLKADHETLQQQIRWDGLHRPGPVRLAAHHLSNELISTLHALPEVLLQNTDDQLLSDAAVSIAQGILDGREPLWIDLRRDALSPNDRLRGVRHLLRGFLAAALVLCFAAIIGWSYRAMQYGTLATECDDQAAVVFRKVLPGQPVPVGVRSRLESEYRRLNGFKGPSSILAVQTSALNAVYDVLNSLPKDLRYRFSELRFERQKAILDGEVVNHGDAETIVRGLRQKGYQIQPPRTQQISNHTVAVRIVAEMPSQQKNASVIKP